MVKDLCFEVIEKCTNNCKFCSSNSCMAKDKIISLDDFKRTVDYFISTGGIEELSLSGGEPFLHSDLLDMVSYSKSKGIRTVIFTSGVILASQPSDQVKEYYQTELNRIISEIDKHEPWNERVKKNIRNNYNRLINPTGFGCIQLKTLMELKRLGLDKIVFDYQGYEYETDSYLMGRSEQSHLALLDSLLNARKVGLVVDVHFIPMKPNYKEIGDILEMLEIAKVPNISLLNFIPQGRGKLNKVNLELSEEELVEFFDILNKNRNLYFGNIRVGISLQGQSTHKCNAGLEKLDIKFDGTILPCPAFKELTDEECKKYGIRLYNIYDSLDQVNISGYGTRVEPLCQKVYRRHQ